MLHIVAPQDFCWTQKTIRIDEQSRRIGKMRESERERKKLSVVLKRGMCSSGYPPAEGRVEHSQGNSSQENYIIFSLQGKKRTTEEQIKGRWREGGQESRM